MTPSPDDWANTALHTRFLFFDAGASIALPVFFLHPRMWTLYLVIASFVVFFVLERRGLTPMVLLAIFRLRLGNLFRWPIHISRRHYYGARMQSRYLLPSYTQKLATAHPNQSDGTDDDATTVCAADDADEADGELGQYFV